MLTVVIRITYEFSFFTFYRPWDTHYSHFFSYPNHRTRSKHHYKPINSLAYLSVKLQLVLDRHFFSERKKKKKLFPPPLPCLGRRKSAEKTFFFSSSPSFSAQITNNSLTLLSLPFTFEEEEGEEKIYRARGTIFFFFFFFFCRLSLLIPGFV